MVKFNARKVIFKDSNGNYIVPVIDPADVGSGSNINNQSTPFCINSGKVDSDGKPDLLDITDTSKVVFKVGDGTGENNPPLKGALANGTLINRTSIDDLSVTALDDGIYNLFVGESGACVPLANTIYRQKKEPTDEVVAGDVWLNTSVKPYISKKWNGTVFEDFNYIPLPQTVTVASGAITDKTLVGGYNYTLPWNTNDTPSKTTPAVVVETYQNGTSWYRIWSDGWIEQGFHINNGLGTSGTATLPLAMTTNTYTVATGPQTGIVSTSHSFYSLTTTNFSWTKTDTNLLVHVIVKGY